MATRKKKNNIGAFGHPIYGKGFAKYGEMRTNGSSEIPNDLEEAARQYFENPENSWEVRDVFIAGAKWQAEQLLKSSPLPEDTVLFNKGVAEGKRLMMEESVEAEISAKFPIVGRSLISVIGMLEGFKYGDKVRVIVLKKED